MFGLFKRKKLKKSAVLEVFEKEIENWPEENAKTALLLLVASIQGDKNQIDSLYPELTVSQILRVAEVLHEMENEN